MPAESAGHALQGIPAWPESLRHLPPQWRGPRRAVVLLSAQSGAELQRLSHAAKAVGGFRGAILQSHEQLATVYPQSPVPLREQRPAGGSRRPGHRGRAREVQHQFAARGHLRREGGRRDRQRAD